MAWWKVGFYANAKNVMLKTSLEKNIFQETYEYLQI